MVKITRTIPEEKIVEKRLEDTKGIVKMIIGDFAFEKSFLALQDDECIIGDNYTKGVAVEIQPLSKIVNVNSDSYYNDALKIAKNCEKYFKEDWKLNKRY